MHLSGGKGMVIFMAEITASLVKALRELRRDPRTGARLSPLVRTARTLDAVLGESPDERLDVRLLETDEEKDAFVALQQVARRAGRSTEKRVPLPGALSTPMRPSIAIASSWQIARPNPLPP